MKELNKFMQIVDIEDDQTPLVDFDFDVFKHPIVREMETEK